MHVLCDGVRNGRSRSSKVIDFGTNRKYICNFLLVININFGLIWHSFKYIAGFLLRTVRDPTPISPEFWGCSDCTRLQKLELLENESMLGQCCVISHTMINLLGHCCVISHTTINLLGQCCVIML